MAKPAIVAVDDDAQVAAAVVSDLRRRYAADYRILAANSGAEALEAVEGLQARGDVVALFLVDQRMPVMSGTEFLVQAREKFPDAKRVLLTAYADTDAAIQAINEVDLDHYLLKPWDPPDDNLYPVLDDLLSDWLANVPAPFDGIRVLGTRWSPDTHRIKDFLARNQIPYRFLDIERDPDAESQAQAAGGGKLPVVFTADGTTLIQPSRRDVAATVGLHTEAQQPFYDLVIVGGGPAGLAGAVYGASEGLRTALIEREAPGGQAQRLGAELLTTLEVTGVRLEDNVKVVTVGDGTELRSHALLIASGMTVRKLGVPGYERFEGAGVYYGAAPSEAATYAGGHVYVVGGANSAGQGAMMFSRFAESVTMIVRSESLGVRMSQYLIDQIESQDNIEVLVGTQVEEVIGEDRVEAIRLIDRDTGTKSERPASALFIFVGAVPHSGFVSDVVLCNEKGFIYTGPDIFQDGEAPETWTVDRDPYLLETSVPGIFAAGDVRHGVVRRVASAVGQGSVVVSMVHQYLDTV